MAPVTQASSLGYAVLYQHVKVPDSQTNYPYGSLKLACRRHNRSDKGKTPQRKRTSPHLSTFSNHQPCYRNSNDCRQLQTEATENYWRGVLGAEELKLHDKKRP